MVGGLTGATGADQPRGAGLRSEYASERRRLPYVEPTPPGDSVRANGVRGELSRAAARFLSILSDDFDSIPVIADVHASDRFLGRVCPPKALPAMGPSSDDMILRASDSFSPFDLMATKSLTIGQT